MLDKIKAMGAEPGTPRSSSALITGQRCLRCAAARLAVERPCPGWPSPRLHCFRQQCCGAELRVYWKRRLLSVCLGAGKRPRGALSPAGMAETAGPRAAAEPRALLAGVRAAPGERLVNADIPVPCPCSCVPAAVSWYDEFQRLYDTIPCVEVQALKEHSDQVLHLSFSHSGCLFASCSKDCTVKVKQQRAPRSPSGFERGGLAVGAGL